MMLGNVAPAPLICTCAAAGAAARARVPGNGRVLDGAERARERDLLAAVGEHPYIPVAVSPAREFADTGVAGHAESADPARVVRGLQPDRQPRLNVLAEITGAAGIPLS